MCRHGPRTYTSPAISIVFVSNASSRCPGLPRCGAEATRAGPLTGCRSSGSLSPPPSPYTVKRLALPHHRLLQRSSESQVLESLPHFGYLPLEHNPAPSYDETSRSQAGDSVNFALGSSSHEELRQDSFTRGAVAQQLGRFKRSTDNASGRPQDLSSDTSEDTRTGWGK